MKNHILVLASVTYVLAAVAAFALYVPGGLRYGFASWVGGAMFTVLVQEARVRWGRRD